ncbi:uncharacterized protein LOC129583680 isoform X4 [Paramacrobiotus metropolitanus]|nr:uncharacterized protein LOC129583680 isoform X4 [Paramacrobiotus metropolitanus]XP_055331566.1 uncharacterized protein LOC129583680 isoform X4 [Paramacrobiotus metropolitanus]XP_055331567.1 uncharacterized protein LOC129583680 isoform X4 [Paramacrobiotus metropolitanus]
MITVSRIRGQGLGEATPSSTEVLDYIHSITVAKSSLREKITGYSLIYSNVAACMFEAHSTKIEEIFQNLDNPSSSFLEDTRIVLFLSDVPARIVNTFVLLPVDTAPTATVYSSGDVAAVAKDFVEKMVHFSLLLSTLYTLEEDEQVKNVSWSLEKAILNPELIDILIRSELTFPVSAFLQFYHGPLHLPRLGDEFEWAYPPGSTKN